MLSGPAHLQCPACNHVFMSTQTRPDSTETCPHCAHVGPRMSFRTLTQPPGAEPVRFQKRMPRAHEPALVQTSSPAAAAPAGTPEAVAAPRPDHLMHRSHQPRMAPASWPGAGLHASRQESPPVPESAIEPQKKSKLLFWTTATLVFLAACVVTGLLAWEKINQRIQRLRAEKIATARAPFANAGRLPMPSLKVDPMEELNQRVLTGTAMAEADKLIQLLFNSTSIAERLTAIARPGEFQREVIAMFEENPARPALVALTPISNPPLSLLTREQLRMFKVVTTANRSGALIRTIPAGPGGALLDWSLFRETHDGLLARHIAEKSREPRWFHVGLRRVHSFDLSKDVSGAFDSIDIDGSTDGSGRVVAYVAKESPLGRHFARHLEWNKFYFGLVLVSWMDLAGETRPVLLDCEKSPPPDDSDGRSSSAK